MDTVSSVRLRKHKLEARTCANSWSVRWNFVCSWTQFGKAWPGVCSPEKCLASEHKRQLETKAAYKPMRATETLQRLGAIAEILETWRGKSTQEHKHHKMQEVWSRMHTLFFPSPCSSPTVSRDTRTAQYMSHTCEDRERRVCANKMEHKKTRRQVMDMHGKRSCAYTFHMLQSWP